MRLRWPWRRNEHAEHAGNGHAARAAREESERKLAAARRQWPEVRAAGRDLADWAEQIMRGQA